MALAFGAVAQTPCTPPSLDLRSRSSCTGKALLVVDLTQSVNNISFLWSTGETSSTILVENGTYWVQITDLSGCTNSDTLAVNMTQAQDYATEVDFAAQNGNDIRYQWQMANIPAPATFNSYRVFYSDTMGGPQTKLDLIFDVNTNSVDVDFTGKPAGWYQFSHRVRYRNPGDSVLNSNRSCYGYVYWDGGCNTFNASVQPSGAYTRNITWDAVPGASSYYVDYRPLGAPVFERKSSATNSRLINFTSVGDWEYKIGANIGGVWQESCLQLVNIGCANPGLSASFRARCTGMALIEADVVGAASAYSYLWNTGETTQSIQGENGTYWVGATDALGCTAYDTVVVLLPESSDWTTQVNGATQMGSNMRFDWTPVVLPMGVAFESYRIFHIDTNTGVQTKEPLISNQNTSFVDIDFSGKPAGWYAFNLRVRYQKTGDIVRNSIRSCTVYGFWNGGTPKFDGVAAAQQDMSATLSMPYPNPATEVVYFEAAQGTEVRLLDMQGRVLMRHTADESGEQQLNVRGLASGTYFLVSPTAQHRISIR